VGCQIRRSKCLFLRWGCCWGPHRNPGKGPSQGTISWSQLNPGYFNEVLLLPFLLSHLGLGSAMVELKTQNWRPRDTGKNPLKTPEKLGCEKHARAKITQVNMVYAHMRFTWINTVFYLIRMCGIILWMGVHDTRKTERAGVFCSAVKVEIRSVVPGRLGEVPWHKKGWEALTPWEHFPIFFKGQQ
jgi:hypothetical protein